MSFHLQTRQLLLLQQQWSTYTQFAGHCKLICEVRLFSNTKKIPTLAIYSRVWVKAIEFLTSLFKKHVLEWINEVLYRHFDTKWSISDQSSVSSFIKGPLRATVILKTLDMWNIIKKTAFFGFTLIFRRSMDLWKNCKFCTGRTSSKFFIKNLY